MQDDGKADRDLLKEARRSLGLPSVVVMRQRERERERERERAIVPSIGHEQDRIMPNIDGLRCKPSTFERRFFMPLTAGL